MKTIILVTHS